MHRELDNNQAANLALNLVSWLDSMPPCPPVNPGHRVQFHWPPPSISYGYHVQEKDWSSKKSLEIFGETFEIEIAKTPYGVFGRSKKLWVDAMGDTSLEMLTNFEKSVMPYFVRTTSISKILGLEQRYQGHIRDLPPLSLLKLLFSEDRDIASDARIEIEKHAATGIYTDVLTVILRNRTHPYRRSAQWCALDVFEDLGSISQNQKQTQQALNAIEELIWDAEDDFARTIFKAGVVLGGHIPAQFGGPILIKCLNAPSKFGRRSAIHGLFHVVEWAPEMAKTVMSALESHSNCEPDPQLQEFSEQIRFDIESENTEHYPEPLFSTE